MTMQWDDLRFFLAIMREGSLSAAARQLKVTQPTVGRRLGGLEQSLGTRLFDRLPDGFVPTGAGTELLPMAETMERAALALSRQSAGLATEAAGTVRVSVWEFVALFLTAQMPALQAALPEIEFELSVTHIQANLIRREADLLIRECLPDNPDLIARRLGDHTFAVYGNRQYVKDHPAALDERRYRECNWAGYDEDHTHMHNQNWLLEQLAGARPMIRANNGMVLHAAVRHGVGLGVLPCVIGDWEADLVRLTPPIEALRRTLYLVVHRDVRRAAPVRAVMDNLVMIFEREAGALMGLGDEIKWEGAA